MSLDLHQLKPQESIRRTRECRFQRSSVRRCLGIALAACLLIPSGSHGASCADAQIQLLPLPNSNDTTAVVDIRNAGDGRLFLVELDGRILVYKNGEVLATPFLDIRDNVAGPPTETERGLFSVAFHPQYPDPPYFYIFYSNKDPEVAQYGDLVLARYLVSPNPDLADPDTADILMIVPRTPSSPGHNGGQLQFGPNDGYLYWSIGDGGNPCDQVPPGCNAQRDDLLLGKLLRLDVDQNPSAPPFYGIPPDNPYVDSSDPRPNDSNDPQRDEIWDKGLRNPFRFSFDPTGNLWIGDVGQDSEEEVDFEPAGSEGGRNYGWPHVEGTACHTCGAERPDCPVPMLACDDPGLTGPVHTYGHGVGRTIIGGLIYRGALISDLAGCYVFGDRSFGKIWALDPEEPEVRIELSGSSHVVSFGEDRSGELYASIGGNVRQFLPAGPTPTATQTETPNPDSTPSPTWTARQTRTPTLTRTPTQTPTPTLTPTSTQTRTAEPESSPTSTASASPTASTTTTPTGTPSTLEASSAPGRTAALSAWLILATGAVMVFRSRRRHVAIASGDDTMPGSMA